MQQPFPAGVFPAFITPLSQNGTLIESAVKELVDYHITAGMHAFYVCGSTGEGLMLGLEMRMQMAETVIQAVAGRCPVVVHVGAPSTREAVQLAVHAKNAGAGGISSVPPFYFKMSAECIEGYYTAIAEAAKLPLLVYNVPMLTGVSISSGFMKEIAKIPYVVGLKYTDTNLEEFRIIKEYGGGQILGYMGTDSMLLSALVMGADGGIGSFYNVMPRAFVHVFEHYRAGRLDEAQQAQWQIDKYIAIVKKHWNTVSIPPIKRILSAMGIEAGIPMPPLLPMKESIAQEMLDDLRQNGFFEFVKL